MNKSPINYVITVALGALLWVATGALYGKTFSESLILERSTPEEFLAGFRLVLGVAAAIGVINCLYWYYYGSMDATAGDLGKAKRVWVISLVLQLTAAAGLLSGLLFRNLAEGLAATDWLIAFGLISLHTWLFYWLCTYLMSPRTVKYIPLFK
jgi:hypothetical protein